MESLRSISLALVFSAVSFCAAVGFADIYYFSGGGVLEGEPVDPEEKSRKVYEIRTPEGVVLKLEGKNVERTETIGRNQRNLRSYYEMSPSLPDTAEIHAQIAEWCEKQYFKDLADIHWKRVIELDTNHKKARSMLGYIYKGREWISPEEINIGRGLQKDGVVWRSGQELELAAEKKKYAESVSTWRKTVQRMFANSENPQTRNDILSLKDPDAVPALSEILTSPKSSPNARVLALKALESVGTTMAMGEIVGHAMDPKEPSQDIRNLCLELIRKHPETVEMAGNSFARFLANGNNDTINQAAKAIMAIGAKDQIPNLIRVLETTHKRTYTTGSPGVGGSFNPTGDSSLTKRGGGITMGQTTRTETFDVKNHAVHEALCELTGVDFGFDRAGWLNWLESQHRSLDTDFRRG